MGAKCTTIDMGQGNSIHRGQIRKYIDKLSMFFFHVLLLLLIWISFCYLYCVVLIAFVVFFVETVQWKHVLHLEYLSFFS